MRCFVAIDIDPSLTKKIELLQEELANLDTKLVELNNLHFTLEFLGDIDEKTIKNVSTALEKVVSNHELFNIDIENVGIFPDEKFIRVIWVGADALSSLQVAVNDALANYFEKEKPSPHLTIARVRSQKHRKEIVAFIKRHKNDKIGAMMVSTIKLKKSTVTSKGPVYEDLAIFRLVGK